ncbi:MAG: glycosyltransferase family 4 protein [Acidimicrobiia bacterium]|nr:glycosyltransferase family 4 protein [Acidimicrobiia bacterium]
MIRIGIDARELIGHPTGVGRYLGGLLERWSSMDEAADCEFVLYSIEPLSLALPPHRFATRVVIGPGNTWWEQTALPAAVGQDALDVFLAPAYTAPLRLTVPLVVAIHDISFIAHPEWFTVREGLRRRWLTRRAARRANTVITISDFTRDELVTRLGVAPERIAVIPPGVTRVTREPSTQAGGVLYVGSVFNRRHLPDLIRGFAPLAREHPTLTLDVVGDNRTYPHEDLLGLIAAERLEAQARWRPWVPDETLRTLYQSARTFAFLSEYEGLGLTPLEALAAGIPVVVLDTRVARESCRDAALYVPPGDVPMITEALRTALFDEPTRRRLLTQAPHALARFDWTLAARETLATLLTAAGAHV